ncbi:MAG: fused MFS/spermidine synthase [Candidatus Melainabacteria bacterium]|jgi:spermidine synthase|nr:fused MFS/spermidine synthase [Candidatus Melainabacteria bacterium]
MPSWQYTKEQNSPTYKSEVFAEEKSDKFDRYLYEIDHIFCNFRSKFQQVLIANTKNYGKILMLDHHIQSAEYDERLYHELLVQPAMLAHPNPKNILILGGGEGASLRECLVHKSVEKATMVDIDGELINVCKNYLQEWHRGAFDDPRATILSLDGRKFIEETNDKFDIIIIDIVDMLDNGPAQKLYTQEFYEMTKNKLNERGIVVVQGMEFSSRQTNHAIIVRTLSKVFSQVQSYRAVIPSFLSSWGFILASDWLNYDSLTSQELDKRISERIPEWLCHLDGDFLKSVFICSKRDRFLLKAPGPCILDDHPIGEIPNYKEVNNKWQTFPV